MSFLALAIGSLAVSVTAIIYGARTLKQIHQIENLPLRSIRSIAMGPVSIQGTIESTNTQLSAFLAQPAVYVKYKIYTGSLAIGRPIHTQTHGQDFFITDGTGTVRVDPTGAKIKAERGEMHTSVENLPNHIREQLSIFARIRLLTNPELTVKEEYLKPNTKTYIRGIATDNPHMTKAGETNRRKDIIIRARSNEQLLIILKEPSQTIQSYKNSMRDILRIGIVVGIFSIIMIVLSQITLLF